MRVAADVGKRLKGGEVIELVSDVGGGKTTFVRGLAAGMGSADRVASPSFTIAREYRADRLTLHHFDFYRLSDPGIIANELAEVVGNPDTVVVIEWADIIDEVLPADRLTIHIINTSDNGRQLAFTYPSILSYLSPGQSV